MATQTDKIRRLEDELKMLDKKLTYYGELFNEDSDIDKKEKAKLAKMQAVIKKAEAKLTKIKKKQISNRDKKFAPARDLITKLENVFIEANLKETSYQKLQDYSMDISDISNRIKAEGVLEPKYQRIVDELDSWDNRIHEEIEKKVAAIKAKKKPKVSTKLSISHDDYIWTPKITGKVEWGEQESKKFNIKDLETVPKYKIPWNTEGKLTLNLSLGFSLKTMPQKKYKREKIVYVDFSVDNKGKFKFGAMNSKTSSQTGVSIEATILDYAMLKIKKLKEALKKSDDSYIPNPKKIYDAIKDNISNLSPGIELLKDHMSKHRFSGKLTPNKTDSSIEIKTDFEIGGVTLDLSVAPFNLGIGAQFSIPSYNSADNIGTITFEAEKNPSQTIEQSTKVQFNKEGDFTIDGDDKHELKAWRDKVKNQLTLTLIAIEQKKNTPKDKIEKKVKHQVRNIFLGNKYSIEVTGFTSSTKSRNKNDTLGYTRADNIIAHLIEMGFKKDRILRDSNGEKACKEKYGDESDEKKCKIGSVVFSIELE